MTVVKVYSTEIDIPLVALSGPADEASGAELADKVMREIYYRTEDPAEYRHPLSLKAACTRVPETWVDAPAGG